MAGIGVRFARTLADLFQLSDTRTIGDIDLRVASPIFDLRPVIVSSLARATRFSVTKACTAAADPNPQSVNPKVASVWDTITGTAGDGVAIPTDHVALLIGASITIGTPANWTNSSLVQGQSTPRIQIIHWTDDIDGRGLRDGLPGHFGQLGPAFAGLPDIRTLLEVGTTLPLFFESNVTGNTDVTVLLDFLSGPRGLFSSPT